MESPRVTEARITSALLDAIGRDGSTSQRNIARELGVALGLVNVYLKRCSKKGLIKIRQAPARRYAYYLTPKGMAEKTRLTAEFLTYSLSYFRNARSSLDAVMTVAAGRLGWRRIALCGAGELAEIAMICAYDKGLEIVAVIDPALAAPKFVGVPVAASADRVEGAVDGYIVTALGSPQAAYDHLVSAYGSDRVLTPSALGVVVSAPVAPGGGRREAAKLRSWRRTKHTGTADWT